MNAVKLQNLRFFVAVYEERSISGAARKVHATQSGVSVQLRDLEEVLGLTLFERTSTGVRPTKAGERIYGRAVRILREVGRLGEDVSALSDHVTGEVRAGIMPTFARAILAPALSAFAEANPLVDVKVTEAYSAVLTQMVRDGELDLAVVPDAVLPDGLRSTYLATDLELLMAGRPLEGVAAAIDLAAVPPLRLVLPGPGNARRGKIEQQLRNFSTPVERILELDSMMTTLDMVARGGWCSILPGCLCLPDLGRPGLSLYPFERPRMTVDYLLIEPAAAAAPVAVQLFAKELSTSIRRACEACRAHFRQSGGDRGARAKGKPI